MVSGLFEKLRRSVASIGQRIFISYRRDDVAGQAGRLYDHLVERFGENSVFMDIDTIPPGEDFDGYIDDILRTCNLCIVVIGRRWDTERLHTEGDFVRREIAIAFERGVRIVPTLFDGAKIPELEKLPKEIANLAHCQFYDFGTGRDFKQHVSKLLSEVDRAVEEAKQRQRERAREALSGYALRPYQYPLWVLFVCALVALAMYSSLTAAPLRVRALANTWKAEAAEAAIDYPTAVEFYRRALSIDATSRDARVGLAACLFSKHSEQDAAEAMKLLVGLTLDDQDWRRLTKQMPAEYQARFERVRKR